MGFKSAVITFPASNCDRDMAVALEAVFGAVPLRVWHGDAQLPDGLDFIALPGGFSYGDYLRAGAMAARSPIMQAVMSSCQPFLSILGFSGVPYRYRETSKPESRTWQPGFQLVGKKHPQA